MNKSNVRSECKTKSDERKSASGLFIHDMNSKMTMRSFNQSIVGYLVHQICFSYMEEG